MFEITPKRVEKEDILYLKFPNNALELSTETRKYLCQAIKKATVIGNKYKNKIKIVFYDSIGLKEVETTVWNSTDSEVVLKDNITIPIHRVVDVKSA